MLTIQSGNTKEFQLKGMTAVVVSNGAGSAVISFDNEVLAAAHTGTKIYGPFKAPGKFKIVATSGDVQYKVETARNKATTVATYATLFDLVAVDAAKYPKGTTVMVGPDAYDQYAEWYSNGVRWRPRNPLITVTSTPSSLPDTTSTETDIWAYTFPGVLLGPKDLITANYFWSYTNNATNKEMKLYFGGQPWSHLTTNAGAGFRGSSYALLRNSKTVQVWGSPTFGISYADGSGSGGNAAVRNINTNQDVVIKAAAKWASGGGGANNITLEYITLRLEFEA